MSLFTQRDTGQQQLNFNKSLLDYFRNLGFTGGDIEENRKELWKILFGTQKPSTTLVTSRSFKTKFTTRQIQGFLDGTASLQLKSMVLRAIKKAGDVADFQLLNLYLKDLEEIKDKVLAKKKFAMYEAYDLLDNIVGSPLEQKIEQLASEYQEALDEDKVVLPLTMLGGLITDNAARYATGIATFSGWSLFTGGTIPCVLGPLGLKHVNEIEIARSGKILKFRASGSVFLANQEGGNDAIRIEGILYKAETTMMWMLWLLFLQGVNEIQSIDLGDKTQTTVFIGTALNPVRQFMDIMSTNTKIQKPSYEYHKTFPFVNKHFIIPNCYIETLTFEDKLPRKDIIKYSILLRTYDKPEQFDVHFKGEDTIGEATIGVKDKKFGNTGKMIEFAVNSAWRTFNASGIIADEQNWKLGSAIGGDEIDTYYDVGADSIASVVFLSIMGMM